MLHRSTLGACCLTSCLGSIETVLGRVQLALVAIVRGNRSLQVQLAGGRQHQTDMRSLRCSNGASRAPSAGRGRGLAVLARATAPLATPHQQQQNVRRAKTKDELKDPAQIGATGTASKTFQVGSLKAYATPSTLRLKRTCLHISAVGMACFKPQHSLRVLAEHPCAMPKEPLAVASSVSTQSTVIASRPLPSLSPTTPPILLPSYKDPP